MSDNETKVLQFQEFTGLDVPSITTELLQSCDWDVKLAVEKFYSDGSEMAKWVSSSDNHRLHNVQSYSMYSAESHFSASALADRLLTFHVKSDSKVHTVNLTHQCTVGELKEKLKEQINWPAKSIVLNGWRDKDDSLIYDADVLRDLNLPTVNELTLKKIYSDDMTMESEMDSLGKALLDKDFELRIHYTNDDQHFTLTYPGHKTIRQVKEDVVEITCPYRIQKWQGWPASSDLKTLAESGINHPVHELTVSKKFDDEIPKSTPAKTETRPKKCLKGGKKSRHVNLSGMDCIEDEQSLMPDDVGDEVQAIEHFCKVFERRFGKKHPDFLRCSFDDIIQQRLLCRPNERKLLAIYLHHDQNVNSNIFCQEVLSHDATIECLQRYYVVWPWDLTKESNRSRLECHLRKHFGENGVRYIQCKHDELPVFLIVWCSHGSLAICDHVNGQMRVSDLADKLCDRVQAFEFILLQDIQEEPQRLEREQHNKQLQAECWLSLQKDQEKERLRREEQSKRDEEVRKQQELKEAEEQRKREIEDIKQYVVEEPPADCDNTVVIKFRFCRETEEQRCFFKCCTVKDLLNYVMSKGYHPSEYRIVRSYPRQCLADLDLCKSLGEVICNQEVLAVEEKF